MEKPITPETVQKTIELGQLVLKFSRVDRVTCHEDGTTPESDTDHTVMLGIVACAFAKEFAPELDRGRIAEFALVHDLVETYAGDTSTFKVMSDDEARGKEEREAQALVRIRAEFDSVYPWLGETIEAYERLDTKEARFVKIVDKVLPKITHILNKGAVSDRLGHTRESKRAFLDHQYEKISGSYGSDQQEAMALLKCLHEAMKEADQA